MDFEGRHALPLLCGQHLPELEGSLLLRHAAPSAGGPRTPHLDTALYLTRLTLRMRRSRQLDLRRPLWRELADAARCHACSASFTLFNRRHRCRPCGLAFCDGCAPARACSGGLRACAPCQTVCICKHCVSAVRGDVTPCELSGFVLSPLEVDLSLGLEDEDRAAPAVCDECDEAWTGTLSHCKECALFLCRHCSAFHIRSKNLKHHILRTVKVQDEELDPGRRATTQSLLGMLAQAEERDSECLKDLIETQVQQAQAQTKNLKAQVDLESVRSSLALERSGESRGSPTCNRDAASAASTAPSHSASSPRTSPSSSLPTDDDSAASTVDARGGDWRIERTQEWRGASGREGETKAKLNEHGVSCLHVACLKADIGAVQQQLASNAGLMWLQDAKGYVRAAQLPFKSLLTTIHMKNMQC
jgi:hypothetical protein